jgi:hypothetical protein
MSNKEVAYDWSKQEVFMFLDELRSTGSINMFGAAPLIEEFFGVDRQLARRFLKDWMKSYDGRVA